MGLYDCEKFIVVDLVSECDGIDQETMYPGLHRSFAQKTRGGQSSGVGRQHFDDFVGEPITFKMRG